MQNVNNYFSPYQPKRSHACRNGAMVKVVVQFQKCDSKQINIHPPGICLREWYFYLTTDEERKDLVLYAHEYTSGILNR